MATVVIQKRKLMNNKYSYLVSYRDPITGSKKHHKTFRRKREADRASYELRALLDSGRLPDTPSRFRPLKFDEVVASCEAIWDRKLKTGQLSPATHAHYNTMLRRPKQAYGDQMLCRITRDGIEDFRADLAAETSNVTSNRTLFVLKQVMVEGLRLGAVQTDPSVGINYLSEKDHERNRFLLPHQLARLLKAARTLHCKNYLPALINLGACHGASKQECLSLKWTDIDFDFEDTGFIRFFRTKNSKRRSGQLMPQARKDLLHWRDHQTHMRHRKRTRIKDSTGWVFSHTEGTPFKGFKTGFKQACRLAKIENFRFHDLRHTFCSNLLLSGADLKDVKEMIGHADIKMTDRYSHLTDEHKRAAQQRLIDHYAKIKR